MKKEDGDLDIARNAARRLDAGLQEIDEQSLERLRRARLAALNGGRAREGRFFALQGLRFTPAGFSLAALAFLVITLVALLPARAPRSLTADDLEIITSKEQVAMLEDLDFYRWLAATGHTRDLPEQSR